MAGGLVLGPAPRPAGVWHPRLKIGVWAEGSCTGGEFTGPVSSSCGFQSVDMGTGLSFLSILFLAEKSRRTNFPGRSIHGGFLWGFSCLLARGFPQALGVLLGAKPPPPAGQAEPGQCLRCDPVLPAPTSILFAGPLGA